MGNRIELVREAQSIKAEKIANKLKIEEKPYLCSSHGVSKRLDDVISSCDSTVFYLQQDYTDFSNRVARML